MLKSYESALLQRWSWKIGIILAIFSGFLFTVNNFLIQYFAINAIEMLLVRSIVQVVTIGLIAAIRRSRKDIIDSSDCY